MKFENLYSPKEIVTRYSQITISNKQRKAAKEWLQLLHDNKLEKETENYRNFADLILRDLLNYPEEELRKGFEKANVEFSFRNKNESTRVLFEAKGTKTKLDQRQNYGKKEQENPIIQTLSYMARIPSRFGVTTNYWEFVLLDSTIGDKKCHWFNFYDIENSDEKLREFIGIFSYEKLVLDNDKDELYDKTINEEKEFTDEFYKLFHETRLMLITEFQEKDGVTKSEAIYYTQIFLNRLIFIFFVEDRGFISDAHLFSNRLLKLLEAGQSTEHSRKVYDEISELFVAFDKGSESLRVFGFNGSLFSGVIPSKVFFSDLKESEFFSKVRQYSKLSKSTKLNEKATKIINQYKNHLSPIISNLLLLDSFNFNTEVNVNILGHIFEQSISDLEELKKGGVSRRKKEGVFYTPEYITRYICQNTIIPYLSKSNAITIYDLIDEHLENIEELENKMRELKILDPACGSGAFLVKAIDVLLEIYKEIQEVKESKGKYSSAGQYSLTKWSEETKIRDIVETNIYGVDINPESVEITKLSLFLKIATSNRKLFGLSKNVQMGNSLIDDKSVESRAFQWEIKFPEVLGPLIKEKGFDIIIGNPPYIRVQLLDHKIIDWLKQNKTVAYRRVDVSILFFEQAKKLLKDNGLVSFITSNQFQVTDYGLKIREFLLKQYKILRIIDFGDLPIFEDAQTYVSIYTLKNSNPDDFDYVKINDLVKARNIFSQKLIKIDISKLDSKPWVLKSKDALHLLEKLRKYPKLSDNIGHAGTGLFTGLDSILLLDESELKKHSIEKEATLPVIQGTDCEKFTKIQPTKYVIYPYKLKENKTYILEETELKSKYPNAYKYLSNNKDSLLTRKDSRKTFADKKHWYGLTRFGKLENFLQKKIVTPGEVREQKFTIDDTKSGFLNARIFSILINDDNYDIEYVLGLLNSKVMRFFLQSIAPLKKGGYYAYATQFLNQAPLPPSNANYKTKMIELVKGLTRVSHETSCLKNRFVTTVANNLGVKITNKLENSHQLSFDEFLNELKKQKVVLSLQKQDEWLDYFNKYKNNICENLVSHTKLESELDELSFLIFDLTDKEKNIVELMVKTK